MQGQDVALSRHTLRAFQARSAPATHTLHPIKVYFVVSCPRSGVKGPYKPHDASPAAGRPPQALPAPRCRPLKRRVVGRDRTAFPCLEVKFILRSDKGLRGREVWVVQRSSVVVQISGVRHAPSVWPGDDKDLSPPTGASASIERAWRARTRGRKVARVPQGQALHPRLPRAVPKAAATAASCLFAHLNQRVHPTPNDRGEGRSPSLPSAGRAMPELRPVSLRDGCVLHDFVLLPAGHPQAVSVPLEARAAQGRGAPAFSP